MNADTHATPAASIPLGRLLKAELVTTWVRTRHLLLAYAGILYGLLFLGGVSVRRQLAVQPDTISDTFAFTGPGTLVVPATLGMLLPLWVWRGEAPSERGYFFGAPVSRAVRTLARVASGWLWLLGCVVAYLFGVALFGLSVAGLDGLVRPPYWGWGAAFISATVVYALTTPAVILTERPGGWLTGAILVILMGPMLLQLAEAEALLRVAVRVTSHLMTALFGADGSSSSLAPGIYARAALVWFVVGLTATLAAAWRYQESR